MQKTVTHQFDELFGIQSFNKNGVKRKYLFYSFTHDMQDNHSSPALLNLAATRAFGLWLETVTFFLLWAVVAVFLF